MRRAFRFLSAASLLLLIGVVVGWITSFKSPSHLQLLFTTWSEKPAPDETSIEFPHFSTKKIGLSALHGRAMAIFVSVKTDPSSNGLVALVGSPGYAVYDSKDTNPAGLKLQWGDNHTANFPDFDVQKDIYWYRPTMIPTEQGTELGVTYFATAVLFPIWMAVVAASVLPCLWLWALLKLRRRGGHNLCRACGYDLRESPERCPECGTLVPIVKPAA